MQDVLWLARIDTTGPNATTGAGLLISDRRVLTCAHVVHGADSAVVRLVNRPGHAAYGAGVVRRGPWTPGASAGDAAVLELDRPVPSYLAGPAPFAPLHRWSGPHAPKLAAYGFPAGHDSGLSSEIRLTRGGFRIGGELIQLEHEGTGMPLSPGFSGGPVVIADTGEVVGIVTAARDTLWRGPGDRAAPAVRLGHMLPGEALARYVPELADLIPGAAVPPDSVRELRLLLAGAEVAADPLELYRSAAGRLGCPDPPTRPESLWEACWYLLSEVTEPPGQPHPLMDYVDRIAELTEDQLLATRLRRWRARSAGAADTVRMPRPQWRPILVDIKPSGRAFGMVQVEISTIRDGIPGQPHARTVPKVMLETHVRDRIEQEIGRLEPDGTELIIVSLPRKLLTTPVHAWARSEDFGPLGADHAVVVVDQQRRSDPADRFQLEKKWETLRPEPGTALHCVHCTAAANSKTLYHRLRPAERTEIPGLPSPPKGAVHERLLAAALKAGAPAVFWPQRACSIDHTHTDTCHSTRILARLAVELADVPPADLPRRIKELRHQAEESGDPSGHWADGLVLLWEDPQVLPSPHRPYRVVPTARPPQ